MIIGPVSKNFQQQLIQDQQGAATTAMFKVPSVQQPQDSSSKRKWQDAFSLGDNCHETMLSLSCGGKQQQLQQQQPPKKSSRLTIFYAGAVNVFDDVPEDMARALMTLAATKTLGAPAVVQNVTNAQRDMLQSLNLKAKSNFQNNYNNSNIRNCSNIQNNASTSTSNVKTLSFPVLDRPQQVKMVTKVNNSSFSGKEESKLVSSSRPSSPSPATSAAVVARPDLTNASASINLLQGLPQARRASIQRFLEKRKLK